MRSTFEQGLIEASPIPLTASDFKPSAVLVPLFFKEGKEYLLLTLRNQQVRHHKGEICFPGGGCDPADPTLLHTALRETSEEIGLAKSEVHVLGMLPSLVTPTLYRITPFVGRIPHPYSFQKNSREVEEILEIPLAHFQDQPLQWQSIEIFGKPFQRPFYRWNSSWVWGATAWIVHELLEKGIQPLSSEDHSSCFTNAEPFPIQCAL